MTAKNLFHPHFLIKYYLRRDLEKIISTHHFSGSILDVGCGEKPYRRLFTDAAEYVGIDYKTYSHNNLARGDKPDYFFTDDYKKTLSLPFRNSQFPHTVAFQVLEHHPEPEVMIREMLRVTQKHGYVLLSCPFIWGLHEIPADYFRYTEFSLRRMIQAHGGKVITITKQGGPGSTIAMLLTDALIEKMQLNRLLYVLGLCLYPLIYCISLLTFLLDGVFQSERIFLNYIILAKKL
jgi:SAM-dependent methyltransferase